MESVIGKVGRFVSSSSSVVVKTPLIESAGLSLVKGVFDLERRPSSEEAVDETMRRSWRLGEKSRSRRRV